MKEIRREYNLFLHVSDRYTPRKLRKRKEQIQEQNRNEEDERLLKDEGDCFTCLLFCVILTILCFLSHLCAPHTLM